MVLFGFTVSMIVVWLVIALIFLIIEALTAGLATIWFAGGAFAALVCALLDLPVPLQVVIFFIVSICLLVFTRKIFVEKLKTGSEKTNVDALIGQRAVAVSEIPAYGIGQVRVGGQVWSAISENENIEIAEGKQVRIHRVEGVKLVVVPIDAD